MTAFQYQTRFCAIAFFIAAIGQIIIRIIVDTKHGSKRWTWKNNWKNYVGYTVLFIFEEALIWAPLSGCDWDTFWFWNYVLGLFGMGMVILRNCGIDV